MPAAAKHNGRVTPRAAKPTPVEPAATPPPAKRLRLLEVALQATYAIDDGATLTTARGGPVVVTAADWPNIVDTLEAARVDLEAQLNSPNPPTLEEPTP